MMQQKTKQLPKGWEGESFAKCFKNISPTNKIQKSKYLERGNLPVIDQGKELIAGYIKDESKKQITNLPVIIFGDHTRRFKLVNFDFVAGADGIKILEIENILDPKFAYYQCLTLEFPDKGYSRHFQYVKKSNLVFPSLPLQQEIVSAIETQFSRLDEVVENLRSVKRKLGVYRKAVLKKGFEGDFETYLIENVIKTTSGGTPSRGKSKYYTGNIPWLKSGELRDNQKIEDSKEHITEEAIKNSSAKIFPKGTVLIAMYGATIGKLGILKNPCSSNQAVCGLLPNDRYESKFIFYYLLNKKQSLINSGKGGAQPNISQTVIRSLRILALDKKEQQKIVQNIEEKFSVIDKVEEAVERALVKAERLRKAVLKVAFEGRLVR